MSNIISSSSKNARPRTWIRLKFPPKAVVNCPHTTAGLTINECWDPDVIHDTLHWLEKSIPKNMTKFLHGEGNSDSHIKTGLFGNSSHVIIEDGKIILGQWQGIFLCEFDGPRTRKVHVQWVGK
jgi:secondary thiamine-phosphate synthase enzyme